MTIANRGLVSTGSPSLNIANTPLPGATTVNADGVGTCVSGGNLNLALNGGTGSLTFLNGSTGDFEQIAVASSGWTEPTARSCFRTSRLLPVPA